MALDTNTTIYLFIGVFTAIGSVYGVCYSIVKWTANKYVNKEVCSEKGNLSEERHNNLNDYLKNTIEQSDRRHTELRDDMKTGFNELKKLIKEGGV